MNIKNTIKYKWFFTLFLPIIIFFPYKIDCEEFIRTKDLKPIHIKRSEFLDIANQIYYHFIELNNDSLNINGYVKLSYDEISTKLNLPIYRNDYSKFPRISNEGILQIESKNFNKIANLNIYFNDNNRNVEIIGIDEDFVIGLSNTVYDKFIYFENTFAGSLFRRIISAIFFVFTFVIMIFLSFKYEGWKYWLGLGIFAILMNLTLYLPNWKNIFPGFLVTVEERTFFEKLAPFITLFYLPCSIIFYFIKNSLKRNQKKLKNPGSLNN